MNKYEIVEQWLAYAARHTDKQSIFMAGIGLLHDGDNAEYYAEVGLSALLRAAEGEVEGRHTPPRQSYKLRV